MHRKPDVLRTLPDAQSGKRVSRKVSLTVELLDSIRPTGKRFRLTDVQVRGLAVDIGETGTITWQVRVPSKTGQRQVWIPIGPYPGIKPEVARKEAERIRGNLVSELNTRQALRKARQDGRIEILVEEWFRDYVIPELAEGTYKSYREKMTLYILPKFKNYLPHQVDSESLAAWHKEISEKGVYCLPVDARLAAMNPKKKRKSTKPCQAERAADAALATFSAFFHWLVKERKAQFNPAIGLGKNGGHIIHRPLTSEGRKKVGGTLLNMEIFLEANPIYLEAFRFCLATGLRRDSLRKVAWEDIDFESQTITLRDKNFRRTGPRVLALGPAAISILQGIPRLGNSPYVFPGRDPSRPVAAGTLNKIWKEVRERAEVHAQKPEWDRYGNRVQQGAIRLHDLRHTKGAMLGAKNKNTMVAATMGLATDKMADRYGKPLDEEVVKANREIERQLLSDLGIPLPSRRKKGAGATVKAPEPTQVIIQIASWPVKRPKGTDDASGKERRDPAKPRTSRPSKIEWPAPEVLQKMVLEQPVTQVAASLGVSDKAVEKHCRKLGLELRSRGYWARKRAAEKARE